MDLRWPRVYRRSNVGLVYNYMSTFLHYVHCKDALLDCSTPGGEMCESLTWVDEIVIKFSLKIVPKGPVDNNSALIQVTNGLIPNRWPGLHKVGDSED